MKVIENFSDTYLCDESKQKGTAEKVIIPETVAEISDAIAMAVRDGKKITVSGMRTGMCGGAVPEGGYVLSLERLNRIVGIGMDETGYFVRAEPCVTVNQLGSMLLTKRVESLEDITPDAVKAFRADSRQYFYPVDPTEMDSSLGGNAATNASGPRTFKYGPTRKWIRGLRMVLHDGHALFIERGKHFLNGRCFDGTVDGVHLSFTIPDYEYNTAVKNSTGIFCRKNMDLIDVFIGSEGIFGVISTVDVRLTEWHPLVSNIMFFPDDRSALDFIREVKGTVSPEFLEYFDCGSIDLIRRSFAGDPGILIPPPKAGSAVFFDLPENGDLEATFSKILPIAERHGGSAKNSWSSSDRKDRQLMFRFRHSVPQAIFAYVASLKGEMPKIHKMGTDMSVPDEACDEMMDYYRERLQLSGLEFVIFGHLGNNHPHVEIILKSMEDFAKAKEAYTDLAAKAISLGGSPSAEHGIGKIKTRYVEMMYGKNGCDQIISLKRQLDPDFLFNPGDMVVIR
jgi:D-lactate dehydrogenase (cytochrome)